MPAKGICVFLAVRNAFLSQRLRVLEGASIIPPRRTDAGKRKTPPLDGRLLGSFQLVNLLPEPFGFGVQLFETGQAFGLVGVVEGRSHFQGNGVSFTPQL